MLMFNRIMLTNSLQIFNLRPNKGGICMKGSIHFRGDRGYYYVSWVHKGHPYKVYKYNGEFLYHKKLAEKLLACMQSDEENGFFRIEKYTREVPTDVVPYLNTWIELQKDTLSPATFKDYYNSIKNHLIPWFEKHPVQLHEIRYDILCQLLNDIKRDGKGKLNVIYCLRRCLDFALKSGRIFSMPPLPERRLYHIDEKPIDWISEARQIKIIQAIPEIHQPIFWWLKYHIRRPSEAMALMKEDYDPHTDSFIIKRAFSAKKLVQHTKTHRQHIVPCHSEFKLIMAKMPHTFSQFFFSNPNSRLDGHHYQHDYLVDLWNKAAASVGETIRMYAGLKHSTCSQYINEKGLSVDELQMLTDHARRDSVLKYADVQLEAKRRIMEKKVISLGEVRGKQNDNTK